ncbi:MAG: hypothetical protein QM831_14020 [Kofleriaceae bacterium]
MRRGLRGAATHHRGRRRLSDIDALDARHDVLSNELSQKTLELEQATKLLEDAKRRAKLPILDNIKIASPCRAEWADMVGDDRVRHCHKCDKQVFDLSAMTREQAEALIIAKNGQLCAKYYQRRDGRVMTSDCRQGLIAARKLKVVAVASLALLGTGVGVAVQRHNRVELDAIDSVEVAPATEVARSHVQASSHQEAPPPPPPVVEQIKVVDEPMMHTMGVVALHHDSLVETDE